jgi:hypothetical protein
MQTILERILPRCKVVTPSLVARWRAAGSTREGEGAVGIGQSSRGPTALPSWRARAMKRGG